MRKGMVFLLILMLVILPGCQDEEKREDTDEEIIQVPEEETEESAKEETEEEPVEYEVELSESLSDFQFAINGVVWMLPSKIEAWRQDGWDFAEDKKGKELETESYVEGELLQKEADTLSVDLVNLEGEKKELSDCFVGGVSLSYSEEGPVYQLSKAITLGKSRMEEVLDAYGTPADEYQEKEDIYITYKFGIYKEAEFVFDIEQEILKQASLKNYREPEQENEEVSKEEPEIVKAYAAPEAFSDNPADYIVSYFGAFYQIPAPVSQFTQNGWRIQEDGSDAYVKAGRHGYVTLEKEGQVLYAVVKNYGLQTVAMENTFVTNVSGDFDVTKVSISIARGITLGMSEEDMKIQLGGSSYETEESEKGTFYCLYSDETKKNFIKIFVDKELKLIREIAVSNSPETLQSPQEDTSQEEPNSSVLLNQNVLSEEE